jgi:putative transposase
MRRDFLHRGMPRKLLIRSKTLPYHVTYRTNNKEWFKLPMEEMWKITSEELYRISILYGAQIHAFTLMSNHLHLLTSTPEADLSKCMEEFAKSVTRTVNLKTGRSGHLFGGRYKWSIIQSPIYYAYALKYVYRNPVRAGIVERVEDYPFSTLQGLLGQTHLPFPLHYPIPDQQLGLVPHEFHDLIDWLNEPFRKELLNAMDQGIQRQIFRLPEEFAPVPKSEIETLQITSQTEADTLE